MDVLHPSAGLGQRPRIRSAYVPPLDAVDVRGVRAAALPAQAGLRAGDRIVAIDGVPLDRYRVFLDAFGRRPAGATLSLDVTGAGGARRVAFPLVTIRDERRRQSDGGSCLVAAARHRADRLPADLPRRRLRRPAAATRRPGRVGHGAGVRRTDCGRARCCCSSRSCRRRFAAVHGAGLGLPHLDHVHGALLFLLRVSAPSPIDRRVPWLKRVLGALALAVGTLLAAACFVSGDSGGLGGLASACRTGPLHVGGVELQHRLHVAGVVSLAGNAFGDVETRRKTRVILAGTVCGFGPITVLQIVLASSGRERPEEVIPFWGWAVAVLAISLVPLSVAYAVVKHRVMELPVLLRRSARYVLVRRGAVTVAVLLGVLVTFVFAALLSRVFTDMRARERNARASSPARSSAACWPPPDSGSGARRRSASTGRSSAAPTTRGDPRAAGAASATSPPIARRSRAEIETALEAALQPEALYVLPARARPAAAARRGGGRCGGARRCPLPLTAPGLPN